jgi:hypothetical protein
VISHIVLFAPAAALSADEEQALAETIRQGVERCPTVRACRMGRRVRHGLRGYEQEMSVDYRYSLILEFDDVEGLKAYLTHPAHEQLGRVFGGGAAALGYDYEVGDGKSLIPNR